MLTIVNIALVSIVTVIGTFVDISNQVEEEQAKKYATRPSLEEIQFGSLYEKAMLEEWETMWLEGDVEYREDISDLIENAWAMLERPLDEIDILIKNLDFEEEIYCWTREKAPTAAYLCLIDQIENEIEPIHV